MITRSRARADREVRRSTAKQRRKERMQRIEFRENFETPYNLRQTMGRQGGNSSRGSGRGSNRDEAFDLSAVAPIVLFPVSEEETPVDEGGSEVLYICNPNDILLFAIVMLCSI